MMNLNILILLKNKVASDTGVLVIRIPPILSCQGSYKNRKPKNKQICIIANVNSPSSYLVIMYHSFL